jgi:hypothetical protein
VQVDKVLDHDGRVTLLERPVHELVGRRVVLVLEGVLERPLDAFVEDDPADRREDVVLPVPTAVLGEVVQPHLAVLVGELGLLRGAEDVRPRTVLLHVPLPRE